MFVIEGQYTLTFSKLVLYALDLCFMRFCSILEMCKLTEITTEILEVPICSCKCTDSAPNTQASSRSGYLKDTEKFENKCACLLQSCHQHQTHCSNSLLSESGILPPGRGSHSGGGRCPPLSWWQPLRDGRRKPSSYMGLF